MLDSSCRLRRYKDNSKAWSKKYKVERKEWRYRFRYIIREAIGLQVATSGFQVIINSSLNYLTNLRKKYEEPRSTKSLKSFQEDSIFIQQVWDKKKYIEPRSTNQNKWISSLSSISTPIWKKKLWYLIGSYSKGNAAKHTVKPSYKMFGVKLWCTK